MKNSECKMQNGKLEVVKEKYMTPKLEIIKISTDDIITTSPGTETTPKEDNDGIWDFDITP